MTINTVVLEGYLGEDPEHHIFENGTQVARFSFASTKYWPNKDKEMSQKTLWIKVQGWKKMAESMRDNFKKGDRVIVEAELDMNEWQDNETKKKRSEILLVAQKIRLCGKYNKANKAQEGSALTADGHSVNNSIGGMNDSSFTVDDIPF